tara:strand:+ start:795 stop:1079 length:285 start_codon:yes stop_codon:yes gene_type:complete
MENKMETKKCPKCGKIKPRYDYSVKRQKRKLKDGTIRTYYHAQSWCYDCRHPHYKCVQARLAAEMNENAGGVIATENPIKHKGGEVEIQPETTS